MTNSEFNTAMAALVTPRPIGADYKVLLTDIETEIAAKRAANPKLDYASAWKLVSIEKPDLIKTYNAAARAKG